MADEQPTSYFIALLNKDGQQSGVIMSPDVERLNNPPAASEEQKTTKTPPPPKDTNNFGAVFDWFESTIDTYRNFLDFMIALAPMASNLIAARTMADFAQSKGKKREDLSNSERVVFEMDNSTIREWRVYREETEAGLRGAKHLPEVMLIGLVSAYDAFLGKLLRVVFSRFPEMVLGSDDKTITLAELSKFDSIDDVRASLIEREIESVLRDSHHGHFDWMQKKFKISLRNDLLVFPKFVELCERRNLFTHTGGTVSAPYIANCKQFGADLDGVKIGDQLSVDAAYYRVAVNVVCEVGIKLCYVLWRKFAQADQEEADKALNQFCFELIKRRNYSTAETILAFSSRWASEDHCRRMMIVNLANAIRLQDRATDAAKILDQEDWSAVRDEFRISVAAVRDNVDEVVSLMKTLGPHAQHPTIDDYRDWPVFRGMRTNKKFSEAFEEIFGEPLTRPTPAIQVEPSKQEEQVEPDRSTLH
jgi:hypothetical protein